MIVVVWSSCSKLGPYNGVTETAANTNCPLSRCPFDNLLSRCPFDNLISRCPFDNLLLSRCPFDNLLSRCPLSNV